MLLTALALAAASARAAAPPGITPAPVALEARQSAAPSTYETTSPLPLTDYFYPYDAQPEQVNPYPILRGPQTGYNRCNSSTEGPDALCQTAVFNSIEDFCFWGAPGKNQTIGDVEAEVVAFCSRTGHGARIFPPGTFKGLQFMRTPAYIQLVGVFDQTAVGLNSADTGGELDPHGADLLGNPLGGLFYSTGFASTNGTYTQTQSWNHFLGSGIFCLKLCDPSYSTDKNYCQNIYDLIGCEYNMPADYAALPGQFVSCEGELQDEVGTYVENGQTLTWSQPDPVLTRPPWTPRVPASSNCVTHQSSDLFPVSALGYQSAATTATSSVSFSAGPGATSAKASSGSGSGSAAAATSKPASAAVRAAPATGAVLALAMAVLVL
ncbi:hypothetical protein CspeluHIS016_0106210 [Cutaneotrichosporon spelunceum]|uniref:Macrofage activating glyco protein n=1 Tax=Cutaneotrichosporon spelunceum TaxID=1672016 RepID=A0AAD3Y847_9TREE|nr:hypothetical protein CspeluHIS016_0106210 [Cutaneotrichosporon spelunceum]